MSKQVIAIDIDDTLCGHFEGLKNWYNQSFGTLLTLADNHPFSPQHWGTPELRAATLRRWDAASVEEAVSRVHRYFDTDAFREMRPYADAARVLRDLANRYTLVVVTARDVMLDDFTRKWLNSTLGDIIQDVHFTARYNLQGKARSKADALRSLAVAYIIDDDLTICQEAAEAGSRAIVFGNYPWNQEGVLPSDVVRCVDWRAVERYFGERRRG